MSQANVDEKTIAHQEAIIFSMTKKERNDISLLGKSRIKRIAAGSGTNNTDVNRFVKQFQMMKKMSKQMTGGGMASKMAALQNAGEMDSAAMGDLAGMGGRVSTKTQSHKKRFKQRKRK